MVSDLPRIVTPFPGRARKPSSNGTRKSCRRPTPAAIRWSSRAGEGAIVEDVDGNRFLDFNAGIAVMATGHSHPRVVEAIREQAEKFLHMSGTDFYYENMVQLAEKLAAAGVRATSRVGSTSATPARKPIEAAMKIARYHTGRDKFVAFFGGFHGRTMGALSLTASKSVQRKGFGPLRARRAPYSLPELLSLPVREDAGDLCRSSALPAIERHD